MLASHTTAINNNCLPLRCNWLPDNAVSFSITTGIPVSACLRTQPQAGMWANVEAAKAGDPRTLDGLFLVLPDEVLQDRATAKEFHKEAFQPPIDAVNALSDMRRKAPATVTVNIRGRRVAYATLWDKRQLYHAPSKWTGVCVCVCVCVFFPFILDIKLVGRTSRGHTGGRSHRISHPPSFCGACLYFSREKGSAIPFPRRP